jgi:phosphatidate phosphatase LPIN
MVLLAHNVFLLTGTITPLSRSPDESPGSSFTKPTLDHSLSENVLSAGVSKPIEEPSSDGPGSADGEDAVRGARPRSPPAISPEEAMSRAKSLSQKLSGSNIPSHITETGDLMLDMTGYKSNEEDALRAEVLARKILAEELEGSYDIGALIGADEHGNLWIYSSEEAKEEADQRATINSMRHTTALSDDAVSDPGYHSEGDRPTLEPSLGVRHHRTKSDVQPGFPTPPESPMGDSFAVETRNYAKTLRLTSDQLKALNLKHGANLMSFSVNKATCTASMYLWNGNVPIVISDIDGTITK